MSYLVNIEKQFDIDTNFWDLNPQLAVMSPFNKLYNRDSTPEKDMSSREGWAIFLFAESSARSKFYRLPIEERKQEIKENLCPHMNWNDEVIKECISKYPILCMSAVERALKEEEDFLIKRSDFIKEQEYTLTRTEIVDGKSFKIEGTAKELDTMAKNSKGIWDRFMEVKAEFEAEEAKSNLRGGRTESKSERGEI